MSIESWRKPRRRNRSRGFLTKAGKPRAQPAILVRPDPVGGIKPPLVDGTLLAPQPDLPPGPTWQCPSCRARLRLGCAHCCGVGVME